MRLPADIEGADLTSGELLDVACIASSGLFSSHMQLPQCDQYRLHAFHRGRWPLFIHRINTRCNVRESYPPGMRGCDLMQEASASGKKRMAGGANQSRTWLQPC